MHHVIIAAHDGRQLQQLLDYVRSMGFARVVFPGREYRSERAGKRGNDRSSRYCDYEHETMRLYPRGDDGGLAERFLEQRSQARHIIDT